jgi:hypothetical protein
MVRSGDRIRTMASVITGVLFVVVAMVALVVAWARATVLDSDRFAATIEQTLAEPEVTRALSESVTERVLAVSDVDGYIGANLPEELAPLAQVLRGAARALAVELVDEVVSSPAARAGLVEASRATHRGFIALLEGGDLPPAVSVEGDEIAVNLLPLITESIERLQARGLLGDIDVPRLNWRDDPTEQRMLLARAIDRDLPEDFGLVVVYRSERVEEASQMVQNGRAMLSLAQSGAWVVYASAVILGVATVALARRRLMAVGALALGSAAALLVARAVVVGIVEEVPGLFTNPGAVTAVATSLGDLSRGLIRLLDVVALIACALTVFALGAVWRRRSGGFIAPIRALVDERPEFVGLGGFALAILLLSVAGVGWLSILAATALVAGSAVVLARPRRAQSNI